MDVCGIDPGLATTGYAVIRSLADGHTILDAGILTTPTKMPLPDRLSQLADGFADVLAQWSCACVAVEQLYAHYKHPRTAVQMAHARGVLLLTAQQSNASIRAFSATHIKRFLTGNGRASKTQVQQAVQSLFSLAQPPEPDDVADAIAIAYCGACELHRDQIGAVL